MKAVHGLLELRSKFLIRHPRKFERTWFPNLCPIDRLALGIVPKQDFDGWCHFSSAEVLS